MIFPKSNVFSPLRVKFLIIGCFPVERIVTTKSPLPLITPENEPSTSVMLVIAKLLKSPAFVTATVAKGTPSFERESIITPFTVVCAEDTTAAMVKNQNNKIFFITIIISFKTPQKYGN